MPAELFGVEIILGGVLRDRIELSIHFALQCPETLAAEGAGGCEAKAW